MSSPEDVAVNPNNTAQRYVLWGNGRIDAFGGAPSIHTNPQWYDRLDLPVAVALHITDWTTGAGYVLDYQGGFQPINGAPNIMTADQGDGNKWIIGVPYVGRRQYVDWAWDPAGNGRGVVLDGYGQLYPFGGAAAPSRTGPRWGSFVAKTLQMRWTPDIRAITMDMHGGLHADYAGVVAAGGPYWAGWDAARDFVVTDWTNGRGYVLDLFGAPQQFGGATPAYGGPYQKADVARTLAVISAANPARFWSTWSQGQQFEWISSTPPVVVAGGTSNSPATTVTTSTRPTLAWSYTDQQKDEQAEWRLLVFTQAWVGSHSMTDPTTWSKDALLDVSGIDRTQRGVVPDFDFANGQYRFYVRAKDTAGQWSAWSNRGWTQNVPVPLSPTGLTATPNNAGFQTVLQASATPGGSANLVRFEYEENGVWLPVLGAEAVPLTNTVLAVDRAAPLGVTRTYRAVAYSDAPRTVSAPSNTASAHLIDLAYVLTSATDPTVGGEVTVVQAPSWTREFKAGVFETLDSPYPTVVAEGAPKSRRATLGLETDRRDQWERVEGVVESNSTLILRDPFGDVMFCRVVGGFSRTQKRLIPYPEELTPLRHNHDVSIPLVEVRPPQRLAVRNTTPPGPAS